MLPVPVHRFWPWKKSRAGAHGSPSGTPAPVQHAGEVSHSGILGPGSLVRMESAGTRLGRPGLCSFAAESPWAGSQEGMPEGAEVQWTFFKGDKWVIRVWSSVEMSSIGMFSNTFSEFRQQLGLSLPASPCSLGS